MQGIIITIEKAELEDIVSRAVETALVQSGFILQPESVQDDLNELIMRSPDLCKYLKIKLSTLYQLTHKKEIPFNKKGKTMFFKKDEIDKWITEGHQETKTEQNIAREIRISIPVGKRLKKII